MDKINTLDDLISYVEEIKNDQQTRLSKNQLITIGLLHRDLPKAERNWARLAKSVEWDGSSESLRLFVLYHKTDSLYIGDNNSDLIVDNDNISTVGKSDMESLTGIDTAAYKEKTQARDVINAYRNSLRKEARSDTFKENLLTAIREQPPIDFPKIPITKYSQNNIEAVLMLSDLHIGAVCNNFYNRYNFDIAKKRLAKLANDVILYCNTMHVTTLHVLNLGDCIQGIIHTNARINSQFNVVKQISAAASLLAEFLAKISGFKFNVTYRSCTDNHSRACADKEENIEDENFSRTVDEILLLKLKISDVPVKFIDDNIDPSIGKFTLNNGKKVMFAHGHLENTNKCLDTYTRATKEFIDYLLLSHFHEGKEKSYTGGKVIVNGSVVGTEDYSFSKRLFSPAEQKLLIFNADNFLNISINLQEPNN